MNGGRRCISETVREKSTWQNDETRPSAKRVHSAIEEESESEYHNDVKRGFDFKGLPSLGKLLSSLVSLFPPELEQELRRRGFKLLLDKNKTNPDANDGLKVPFSIVTDKPEHKAEPESEPDLEQEPEPELELQNEPEPEREPEPEHFETEPVEDRNEKNSVPYSAEGEDAFDSQEDSQESLENDYLIPESSTRRPKSTTPVPDAPDSESHENLIESKFDELRASLAKMHEDRQHDIDQLVQQRQKAQDELLNQRQPQQQQQQDSGESAEQEHNNFEDGIRQRQNKLIAALQRGHDDFGEAIRQRQQVVQEAIRQNIKAHESGNLPILIPPNAVISVGRLGSTRGQNRVLYPVPDQSPFSQPQPRLRPMQRIHVNLVGPLQPSIHNNPEPFSPSQFGQGQFGQDRFGQGQFSQGQVGQGQFGQGQFGQDRFGQPQLGQGQFRQSQPNRDQFDQGQFGQGQLPFDQNLPRKIPVRVTRIQQVVVRKFLPKPNGVSIPLRLLQPQAQHPSKLLAGSVETESDSGHHHSHRPHKHRHHHHRKPGMDIRTKTTHIRLNPHRHSKTKVHTGKPFTVFLDENPAKTKTPAPSTNDLPSIPNLSSLFDILRFLEQNESPVHVFPSSLRSQRVGSVSGSNSLPPLILSGSGVKVMGIPFDIINNKLIKRDTTKAA